MNKADKINDLVFEALFDIKNPKNATKRKGIILATMVQSLSILSKETRYEEDIQKLLREAEKYIYD